MSVITTRQEGPSPKGSPLTYAEADNNFLNLNTDKFEKTGDTAGYVDLDTTPPVSTSVPGRLVWNDGEGSADLGLKGGNLTIQLGQEQASLIYNGTGATLTKGQVVYINGAQGQRPSVALANNSSDATSASTFGIVAETIANGAEGFVVTLGYIKGIDTSAFSQGAALWLGSTAGTVTTTKPIAPNHIVLVGYCVSSHATSGKIFVKVQNGYELDEIHDVLISNKTDNDVLIYNSTTDVWQNKAQSNLNAGTVTNGVYTTGSYSNPSWITSLDYSKLTGTIPTWNQNTTGTAANVTGIVAVANGGTGVSTITGLVKGNGTSAFSAAVSGTDYIPTDGTGATGTWGISITGNAATVTNGVYTNGSYADPTWITSIAGSKVSGNIAGNAGNVTGTVLVANGGTGVSSLTGIVKGNGSSAFTPAISGTDYLVPPSGTSILKANSGGALANAVAGTDYVGLDGSGATGTWSISVTGNAGTVTNGLYSTGSYSDPSWITSLSGTKVSGNISGNSANVTGTVAVTNGGTGQTTYTDGQLLIGNSTGNTLAKATLTAGSNISITNGPGTITIASTGGGSSPWTVKTSNYTAVAGDKLLTSPSAGSFTITLPATPSTGDSVIIADANDWSTTNVIVARNGSTIEGLSEDLTLNVKGTSVELVYDGTTWEVFATAVTGATAISTGKAIAMAMVFSGVN